MGGADSNTQAQLADLLGNDAVVDAASSARYAIGSFIPTAVARPADADGVAAVMAWAHRNDVAVYPSGGRTLISLGNIPSRSGIALDTTRLDRLIDFQPADLTARAQAGMTIRRLDAELRQEGKSVPLAPPLADRATVGGTLATGISGPLRAAYGLPRDWLIGVSVVGADGVISKAGGQVVKNVTGYDLNRLYTGSLGTLAVITEATFKITPAPTALAAVAAEFPNNRVAVAACRRLLAKPFAPQGLHVLRPEAARRLSECGLADGRGPVAIALIAGRPASAARRLQDTAVEWSDAARIAELGEAEAVELTEALADLPVNPSDPPSLCVRLNAPPSCLESLLEMDESELSGAAPAVIVDAGFGGGRLMWWADPSGEDAVSLAERLRRIQTTAIDWGGDAIVEICPEAVKRLIDVWGPASSGLDIMRRIKRQFDPKGILNPGRFIGGL